MTVAGFAAAAAGRGARAGGGVCASSIVKDITDTLRTTTAAPNRNRTGPSGKCDVNGRMLYTVDGAAHLKKYSETLQRRVRRAFL